MAQPTVARFRRASVAVKVETTYGTDALPVATDIIAARNVVFRVNQAQLRDERITGLLDELPSVPGARFATLTFEAFLRGSNAAYSASVKPELDALLRAMGLSSTGSFALGLESYTYAPQTGATMGESVTAKLYAENAPQGVLLGAFGTGTIRERAGEPAILSVTLQGLYVVPGDVALVTGAPSGIIPPVFKSGAVTVNAITLDCGSLDLDLANDLQPVVSANASAAIANIIIAGRRYLVTLDPLQQTVATINWHSLRDTPTLSAASWQVGTAQYNRVLFSGPKFQVLDVVDAQRNGLRTYRVSAMMAPSVGADQISIVYS